MTLSTVSTPVVARTQSELDVALSEIRARNGQVALVPTMGALHAGHEALIAAAHEHASHVAVSIFVNPLQFGPAEDYQRYPRQFAADLAVCQENGVSLVFAPDPIAMYQNSEPRVTIDPGPLGSTLEGASRPGHFSGVLTVVSKLFHLIAPTVAVFGEKDYQQLVLIRQLVRDLNFPVNVVPVPTVRESDGLALSSRNAFLQPVDRRAAVGLSQALDAGQTAAPQGGPAVIKAATEVLAGYSTVDGQFAVDYLKLTGVDLGPPPDSGPARLLIAAQVGATRLIDNVHLDLGKC